jgi:hypothetical protein
MRKLLHIIPGFSVLPGALDVDLRLGLSCSAKVRRNPFNPQRFAGILNGSIRESLNPMALSQRCPRLHSETMDLRPACPCSTVPGTSTLILRAKLYKSQPPVVEKALETAGLMLGTDKSRGYCLKMICADFLACANLEEPHPQDLLWTPASGCACAKSSLNSN